MAYQGKYTTDKTKKRRPLLPALFMLGALILAALLLTVFLRSCEKPKLKPETPTAATEPTSALTAECFAEENGFLTCTQYPAKIGIDVSTHQGEIDWQQVAGTGVEVAIVRIGGRGYTEGGIFRDDCFHDNVVGAHAENIETGAYFYSQATSVEEAIEEAEAVCEWVAPYDMTYPIIFDWERVPDGRTASVSYSEITAFAEAFCRTIEEHGYRAGVYLNLEMAACMDTKLLNDYDFWLAQYSDCPSWPDVPDGWQYSDKGTVAGISGTVDLDIFFE